MLFVRYGVVGGFVVALATVILVWAIERPNPPRSSSAPTSLRIGYAVEPPYAFVDRGGRVTGESPAVARVIAERLGYHDIRWIQTSFGSLIDELLEGRYDVVAAGMFITRERASRVAFSRPTVHVASGLLVPRTNPRHLHSYPDAIAAGARVAVIGGSIEEALLLRLGCPTEQLLRLANAASARSAVETGEADALALSLPTIRWMAADDRATTAVAEPFDEAADTLARRLGFAAFAFRQDDAALIARWNRELGAFLGSPEHRALVAPFGFTADMMPGEVSASDVLQE